MTRQPNEYWLKYMLVFSGLTHEQIVATAEMYQLVPPTVRYLRQLETQLNETKPRPFRGESATCRAWTRRQRIMSLASSEPHAVAARELLADNKVRPVLEALLIADTPLADVATYVERITRRVLPIETIDKFRHYFWDRDLLSQAEWRTHLQDHPKRTELLASHQLGTEYALWTVGYRVEVAKQDALQLVLHESTMRFAELKTFPNGMKTATAARFWADNMFRAIDTLDKTGDSIKQVVDELRSVAIRLGRREITSIDQKRLGKPGEEKK